MNAYRSLCCCCLLVVACSKEAKPDRTREQFCTDWARAACSEEVISVCQAESAEDCHASQEALCRTLVPKDFSDESGDDCIAAVKDAYKDADLKADELATVLKLGAPCNQIIVGLSDEGESCTDPGDCDASLGLACVRKADAARGTCQLPDEVEGGRDCKAAQKTCTPGFYCNGQNCIEAKDLGDVCTIQEECGEAGFCDVDGACQERLAVNEVCTSDFECGTGICYEFAGDQVCTDRIRLARSEPLCDGLR